MVTSTILYLVLGSTVHELPGRAIDLLQQNYFMIKAVIFDFGGVIIELDMAQCFENLRALGIDFSAIPMLTLRDEDGESVTMSLMRMYNVGKISTDEFVDTLLKHSTKGTTRQQVVDAWNSCLLTILQYKLDFVDELRAEGYATFVLSNTNDLHWRYIEQNYGEKSVSTHFNRCFLSHEMGWMKPDSEIYKAMLRQIPYRAEECVFIDDSKKNCEVAETMGIRSCCVTVCTDYCEEVRRFL